ncbi:MAG TPA: cyclic nucleotide-binding domain-containing protein [Thermoanaerobaculia bacterium]|nr:cyclic nucleotide-binding domain-containing protein [Thermoanaerobaculia bacterium]
MAEETESIATLLARREYVRAVPLLKKDLDKYPTNVRIRLQYADALAGSGNVETALDQYEATSRYYEDNGLTVQAIAVRKKSEKLRAAQAAAHPPPAPVVEERRPVPKSPLFEHLSEEEREAVVREMILEQFDEGDIVITEGEVGSSLYVMVSGEVKVFSRGPKGDNVYLAKLGEGDFFGEVSILTGRPRTATITASQRSELLRLDKEKLDDIVVKHPRVKEILDAFYKRRASHTVEAMIETLRQKKGSS